VGGAHAVFGATLRPERRPTLGFRAPRGVLVNPTLDRRGRVGAGDPRSSGCPAQALGVLRKVLEAEPRADLNALWAELPEAQSLPDWLTRGLGWPESFAAERVTDATRPIQLDVQAVGALDGLLACYDSTQRTTWMGWRRDEVRGIEFLDAAVADSLMANGFSARLSPDGHRILLLNGARSLISTAPAA